MVAERAHDGPLTLALEQLGRAELLHLLVGEERPPPLRAHSASVAVFQVAVAFHRPAAPSLGVWATIPAFWGHFAAPAVARDHS